MPTYYFGRPKKQDSERDPLPASRQKRRGKAEQYLASEGLAAAANVAISLGQPLLLTGEPGCGKTQFAEAMADELGLTLYRFSTKSTSVARDLLYSYDAIAHFRQGQATGTVPADDLQFESALPYIKLKGLGAAIVSSNPSAPFASKERAERSLLLIDEIDKAPRDFPNDLLHELDRLSFSIQELGGLEYEASEHLAPIVVITSNSEKHLPDAFLRRCSYFHITFPEKEDLEKIILMHLDGLDGCTLLSSTLEYFEIVREAGLGKKPGLSELIQFLLALQLDGADLGSSLKSQHGIVNGALGVLFKNPVDLKLGSEFLG